MENLHKFWYSQHSFKKIHSNIFQWKAIPYQDFILTKIYSWAVVLLEVDVNNTCSIFHQQLFQDSELPKGEKNTNPKPPQISCEVSICHSCQTGNTSIYLERWTFFCLTRTLHSKKDYKIIPDYRGRSNFPCDLLCNEPRLSICVAPPDNIHV